MINKGLRRLFVQFIPDRNPRSFGRSLQRQDGFPVADRHPIHQLQSDSLARNQGFTFRTDTDRNGNIRRTVESGCFRPAKADLSLYRKGKDDVVAGMVQLLCRVNQNGTRNAGGKRRSGKKRILLLQRMGLRLKIPRANRSADIGKGSVQIARIFHLAVSVFAQNRMRPVFKRYRGTVGSVQSRLSDRGKVK